VLFTRAEETGFIGAQGVITSELLPENSIPIIIETSSELEQARIGQGVILRVGDRFAVYNSLVESWIYETAVQLRDEDKIKFQRALMDGGTCEASLYVANDFDAGALAIALGNYHNIGKMHPAPEYISLSDLHSLVELASAVAQTPFTRKRMKYLKNRVKARFKKMQDKLADNPYLNVSSEL